MVDLNMEKYIDKDLCKKVLMVGVTFDADKPNGGGQSAVVYAYNHYFERLRYVSTWKQASHIGKILYFLRGYFIFLYLMIFDRSIKIVHIHAASGPSFERKMLLAKTAKLFGKKIVLHMHAGDFDNYYQKSTIGTKKRIRELVLGCDKLIALSHSWVDYYIKFGKPAKDVILLNNIVIAPTKINPRTDTVPVHFLFLGWLGDKKGVFDLLDTIIANKDCLMGKFHLRLGGFDNYNKIRSIIADNGLEHLVTLVGWVSGEKKIECLEWADVFILPSYYEGLPISILEAMSYGMPIISTPVGGIPEVVKDGDNGFLVTPGDKKAIFKAINTFVEHPEIVNSMGQQSLKFVEPYYPKQVLEHLRKIYEDLL